MGSYVDRDLRVRSSLAAKSAHDLMINQSIKVHSQQVFVAIAQTNTRLHVEEVGGRVCFSVGAGEAVAVAHGASLSAVCSRLDT
jgi:hypothetical protein